MLGLRGDTMHALHPPPPRAVEGVHVVAYGVHLGMMRLHHLPQSLQR